jgi:hypothetical protein
VGFCEEGCWNSKHHKHSIFLTRWTNTDVKILYHTVTPSQLLCCLVASDPGTQFCYSYPSPWFGSWRAVGFHVQFAEAETCSYEVHRPFLYKMKTNTEILESEGDAGMWREKPSGLLALLGHRPPCSSAATKTTCAHNFEANSSVRAYRQQLTLQLDTLSFRPCMRICAHVTYQTLKRNKRQNKGEERRRRKDKKHTE